MKKNIILLSIFAISFSFFAFNVDNIEKQWKKIERKVQKKGIEYVLTDALIEKTIDNYLEGPAHGSRDLSWSAREKATREYMPDNYNKDYHRIARYSGIGWYSKNIVNNENYDPLDSWSLEKLQEFGFNKAKTMSLLYLRNTIHKAAVSALNDQFLIEEIYFQHKDILVKKFQGQREEVEYFLNIVNRYLKEDYDKSYYYYGLGGYGTGFLARREAAGGRQLIVTYQVLLEDLLASL